MKLLSKSRGGLVALLALAWSATPAVAQDDATLDLLYEIDLLGAVFNAFTPFPWTEEENQASYLYADTKNTIRHLLVENGRTRELWKSFPLEGSVREVFAEDLDGNGRLEIIAFTTGARIYVWDTDTQYTLKWESIEERFETISAMAIADVDRDPALELIAVADNVITYYDGKEFFREKAGRDVMDPQRILIADVDGDLTDEIVTSDGYVLDTTSLSIEWATDSFGYPIELFDIDDDGILDLVAERGGALQFWSIKDRREIW